MTYAHFVSCNALYKCTIVASCITSACIMFIRGNITHAVSATGFYLHIRM